MDSELKVMQRVMSALRVLSLQQRVSVLEYLAGRARTDLYARAVDSGPGLIGGSVGSGVGYRESANQVTPPVPGSGSPS